MNIRYYSGISLDLTKDILKENSLRENFLSDYFRKNKKIGSKDRKIIQDLTYNLIRHLIFINYLYNKHKLDNEYYKIYLSLIIRNSLNNENNYLKSLLIKRKIIKNESVDLLKFIEQELQLDTIDINSDLKNINFQELKDNFKTYYSIPDLYEKNLDKFLPTEKLRKIYLSLLKQANFTIRLNFIKTDEFKLLDYFKVYELDFSKIHNNIEAFTINKRLSLQNHDLINSGIIEIQDFSSILVGYAIDPQKNEKILDACAGAGGKSLHLASLSKNHANIFAYDINQNKLKELNKRAKRADAKINIIGKNDLKKYNYDKILIDAPCTGSGTIKRNPALKYKITDELIDKYSNLQYEILNYYSKLLKNNGKLIYVTCSIFKKENNEVIERFLNENKNFKLQRIDLKKIDIKNNGEITIYPDDFDSDGFFISLLIKQY